MLKAKARNVSKVIDRCAERSAAYHPPPYFNIDCPQSLFRRIIVKIVEVLPDLVSVPRISVRLI